MPEKLQKEKVDTRLTAPSRLATFFADNQFWKRELTNNDFLRLYERGGLGFKVANKISNDLFDKGFETENEQMKRAIEEHKLNEVNWFAYLNAYVSKFCLVFIGYADGEDYEEEANTNARIGYFYVIPREWISQDRFHGQTIEDFYVIYRADGSTFRVHKSRVIRYSRNKNEISAFEPAYNALDASDNVLWSTGQTMWRVGQGFPFITIKDPQDFTVNGVLKSEVDMLRESGALKDISSETGFIGDERYSLKFVGAEGVALRPKEYWDIVFTNACMGLEIPKAIAEGVVAGKVTGSETNLKDYYSDISSKQKRQAQPLYEAEMKVLGINVENKDFNWQPLFELSQKDISENLMKDSLSFERFSNIGVMTVQEIRETLENKYPDLKIDLKVVPEKPVKPTPFSPFGKDEDQGNDQFPKAEFKKKTKFHKRDSKVQKIENEFFRKIKKKYNATRDIIIGLVQGFNTDSIDAITENKFKPLTTRIGKVFANEKDVYRDIVNKYIDMSFVEGLDKAKAELAIDNSLINFGKADKLKKILKDNTISLTTTLLDNVEKDATLLLTDVSLNEIPFSNIAFKKEIQKLFDRRLGQLNSQVISETTRSNNQGLEFGFKESGVVTHKIWQSIIDDRTSGVCRHLNGEIVELGKPFSTGDYNAPAHINCRSSVAPLTLSETELSKFKQ